MLIGVESIEGKHTISANFEPEIIEFLVLFYGIWKRNCVGVSQSYCTLANSWAVYAGDPLYVGWRSSIEQTFLG